MRDLPHCALLVSSKKPLGHGDVTRKRDLRVWREILDDENGLAEVLNGGNFIGDENAIAKHGLVGAADEVLTENCRSVPPGMM